MEIENLVRSPPKAGDVPIRFDKDDLKMEIQKIKKDVLVVVSTTNRKIWDHTFVTKIPAPSPGFVYDVKNIGTIPNLDVSDTIISILHKLTFLFTRGDLFRPTILEERREIGPSGNVDTVSIKPWSDSSVEKKSDHGPWISCVDGYVMSVECEKIHYQTRYVTAKGGCGGRDYFFDDLDKLDAHLTTVSTDGFAYKRVAGYVMTCIGLVRL
jgi:hypothetical protein